MDDKEYEAQKARVKALIDKWLTPLYLKWYDLDIDWHREKHCEHPDDAFRVNSRWRYADATIYAYLPNIVDYDDEHLELVFIHECMHIVVNEMRPMDGDAHAHPDDWLEHEERVCTMLAKAFQCVRDYAKDGKL